MFEFSRMDAMILSLLAYFDIFDYEVGMSVETFANHLTQSMEYMDQQKSDLCTLQCLEFAKQFNYERYRDLAITDYLNLNNASGLVIMRLESEDTIYLCFRGSEFLDHEYDRCGWEDWKDNLLIFQTITLQQLQALNYLNAIESNKKIVLLGHSKGGNLALFLALTCNKARLEQIEHVYSFNAPGISETTMECYKERANDKTFLNKLSIYENEHDAVSSFFVHLKEPEYFASVNENRNLQQMFHNHQLYSLHIVNDDFELREAKSLIPRLVDTFINQFFVKLPQVWIDKVIGLWDDYVESDYNMDELYHIFLYHIGKYTNIFDELSYGQIKEIEFETLIEEFKREASTRIAILPKLISRNIDAVRENNADNRSKRLSELINSVKIITKS